MKKKLILSGIVSSLCMVSCIQEEALNVEAAVDDCKGNSIQLAVINHETKSIDLYVNQSISLDTLRINFTLPEGAEIEPEKPLQSDKAPVYDFSIDNTRNFIVTSESKNVQTQYAIEAIITNLPTEYKFETLLDGHTKFDIFTERQEDNSGEFRFIQWASGNPGFVLTGMGKDRTDYPTVQENNGMNGGKCVKLTTRSTGFFGASFGMPIASGNLFIGSFDQSKATFKPLEATQLGFPFKEKPISISGWYKYKRGEKFTDKNNNVIPDKKDRFDIYGVLYETDENTVFLDGSNSLNSPNIVLIARIDENDAKETDKWTEFKMDFKEAEWGKTFDKEKLLKGKYKLAIVLASSVEGAFFKGAVGSTLYVDDIKLETEKY